MELEIHNTAKITRSIVKSGDMIERKWRTITITTDKGEEIEITCWSKNFSDLLIKEEE